VLKAPLLQYLAQSIKNSRVVALMIDTLALVTRIFLPPLNGLIPSRRLVASRYLERLSMAIPRKQISSLSQILVCSPH
jgi:hypothetical protein